jgi:hypothetical protein
MTYPRLVTADPRVRAPDFSTAPCRDLPPQQADELAFPDRMFPKHTNAAKALCGTCPQATNCLLYVLANPDLFPTGVLAATTPTLRDRLRARLKDRLGSDWVTAATKSIRNENTATSAAVAS